MSAAAHHCVQRRIDLLFTMSDNARARDCILRFRQQVLKDGSLRPEEMDVIDRKNKEKVDLAVIFAEQSPLPAPAELYTDVFVTEPQ